MKLKTVSMCNGKNPQSTIIVNESEADKFKKMGFTLQSAKQPEPVKQSETAPNTNKSTKADDKGKSKQTGAV